MFTPPSPHSWANMSTPTQKYIYIYQEKETKIRYFCVQCANNFWSSISCVLSNFVKHDSKYGSDAFARYAFAPMFLTWLPIWFDTFAPLCIHLFLYVLTPLPLSFDTFALFYLFLFFKHSPSHAMNPPPP